MTDLRAADLESGGLSSLLGTRSGRWLAERRVSSLVTRISSASLSLPELKEGISPCENSLSTVDECKLTSASRLVENSTLFRLRGLDPELAPASRQLVLRKFVICASSRRLIGELLELRFVDAAASEE